MPEILLPCQQCPSDKGPLAERKQRSYITTCTVDWLYLPYELWLTILADYGITSGDLFNLDRTCKWFKCCWGGERPRINYTDGTLHNIGVSVHVLGGSMTEEAARNIIKRYKRPRFGDLINRSKDAIAINLKTHFIQHVCREFYSSRKIVERKAAKFGVC